MKLKKYFRTEKMPEIDKLITYEKIRQHIEKESLFNKISLFVKVGVYSIFLIFVIFGLFSVNKKKVYADYIGKVITSTGNFQILENNSTIKTNLIKNGDIIKLGKKSYIRLQVNEGIKLYLIGPAKIQISKYRNSDNKEIYVINMLDGNYLTVKSNSTKDKLVIKSKYLNIESNDNLVDLKYTKNGAATIIENNGGNIIVKNKEKVLALSSKEKLIYLAHSDLEHIKNIFSDNYKKYIAQNGQVKIVITSDQVKKLSYILSKKAAILATGKFVLGSLNNDKKWTKSGKNQLITMLVNTYNILNIKIPDLLKTKIKTNQLTIQDLENLVDYLITNIENKYIIPEEFIQRLKVILAYLIIVEKIKVKPNQKFPNLSYLVSYLKIEPKYQKMLLSF